MKKIITLMTALAALGIAAHAEVVSSRQAAEVAARVFGVSKVSETPVWSSAALPARPADEAPLFYAFNNPDGGWVIIAGDNCNEPVIGYGDSGEFVTENMPQHVLDFFCMLAGNIDANRRTKVTTAELEQAWKTAGAMTKAPAEKLLTTASWNQSSPYNDMCPTVDGYKAVTGCVQTAHAIVMRYFEWPEYPVAADLPAYTYLTDRNTTRTQPGHSIGTVRYDWADMPLTTTALNKASDQVRNSLAQAMFDLGVMNQAKYNSTSGGANGTGAYSRAAAVEVPKYMKYRRSTHVQYRDDCSYIEWCNILKSNIDNDIPLIYSGSGSQGGHCFVMDGYAYRNNGLLFHYNFGWGGGNNGYYSASTAYQFPQGQDVILGFVPDYDGSDSSETRANLSISPYYTSDRGLSIAASQIGNLVENTNYSISVQYLWNNTGISQGDIKIPCTFNGTLQLIHYRADGTPVEAVGSVIKISLNSSGGIAPSFYNCKLSDIRFGDYIALGYINSQDGTYTPDQFYTATGTVINGEDYARIPMDQTFVLNMKDEYAVGEGIILKDAVGYSKYPRTSVTWTVNGQAVQSGAEQYVPASEGTYEITATVSTTSYGTYKVSKLIEVK